MPIIIPNAGLHNEKDHINVVFSVTVDFNSSGYHKFGKLRPLHQYDFHEAILVSYESITSEIIAIINGELKPIAKIASNNAVQSIDVLETQKGSILVLFNAVMNVMQFVGGINDFYESVELIRKLANTHIKHRLEAYYGDYFNVDTTVLTHSDKHPSDTDAVSSSKKGSSNVYLRRGRDSFFYYLLIANVILLCLLVALVFKAVMKVYFV